MTNEKTDLFIMIEDMWKEDSKIDIFNLHTESTKIPQLHGKYYEIHTKIYNERRYNHWLVTLNSNLTLHSINPTPFLSKNVGMMIFINSMIENEDELLISGGIEDNQNFIWPVSKSRLVRFIR